MERDFDTTPYTPDEIRVADWLIKRAPYIGAGDDPVGFLMASYEFMSAQLTDARRALAVTRNICGKGIMNCHGAHRVKAALDKMWAK